MLQEIFSITLTMSLILRPLSTPVNPHFQLFCIFFKKSAFFPLFRKICAFYATVLSFSPLPYPPPEPSQKSGKIVELQWNSTGKRV
jgi:hypothetical protein